MSDFHPNVLNGKQFIQEILRAVRLGKLKEPFKPCDIKNAVPGWDEKTYNLFPWKHCLQNPSIETTPLFYYVGKGVPQPRKPPYKDRKYRLLRDDDMY